MVCIVSKMSLNFCSLLRVGKYGRPQSLLRHHLGVPEYAGWNLTSSITMTACIILQSYAGCLLRPCSQAHENSGHYGPLCLLMGLWCWVPTRTILCHDALQLILARTVMHSCSLSRKPARSCSECLLQQMWQSPEEAKGNLSNHCLYLQFLLHELDTDKTPGGGERCTKQGPGVRLQPWWDSRT